MFAASEPDDIDRFFRGLTEYAFHARLGIVDPPLVDYVSLLLVRFLRVDAADLASVSAPAPADVVQRMVVARQHAAASAVAVAAATAGRLLGNGAAGVRRRALR